MKSVTGNERSPATPSRSRLLLLCVAQFVVVLDVTIVAIALPAIGDDLGVSATGLQWVISAYTLTFGGLLMLAGRAADLYGRRRAFRAGLTLFAVASLACALAPAAAASTATSQPAVSHDPVPTQRRARLSTQLITGSKSSSLNGKVIQWP